MDNWREQAQADSRFAAVMKLFITPRASPRAVLPVARDAARKICACTDHTAALELSKLAPPQPLRHSLALAKSFASLGYRKSRTAHTRQNEKPPAARETASRTPRSAMERYPPRPPSNPEAFVVGSVEFRRNRTADTSLLKFLASQARYYRRRVAHPQEK